MFFLLFMCSCCLNILMAVQHLKSHLLHFERIRCWVYKARQFDRTMTLAKCFLFLAL